MRGGGGGLLERPRGMASSHREFQHNWMWKSENRKMSPADHYGLDRKCLPNSVCWSLGCQFRSSGDVIESWKLWPHQWVIDDATAQGVLLGSGIGWRKQFTRDMPLASIFALVAYWLSASQPAGSEQLYSASVFAMVFHLTTGWNL